MASTYSPIDESSFNDASAYDAEAILNGNLPSTDGQTEHAAPAEETRDYAREDTGSQAAATGNINQAKDSTTVHESNIFARISRSRIVQFFGLILVIFAAYTFIVSVSYFTHIGSDQSAMLNSDFDPAMIKNVGGPLGAILAHTLLYNWLGIGSFFLILYVGACGLTLMRFYHPGFWNLTSRCLLTAISVSVISGLITYEIASPIYWGGRHGQLLNERLVTFTGIWGALGVSIILAGMMVYLYLTELKLFFALISERYSIYSARQAERRAERDRIRAEREAMVQTKAASNDTAIASDTIQPDSGKSDMAAPIQQPSVNEAREGQPLGQISPEKCSGQPEIITATDSLFKQSISEEETEEEDEVYIDPAINSDSFDNESKVTDPDSYGNDMEYEKADDEEADDTMEESLFPSRSRHSTSKSESVRTALDQPLYDPRADLSGFKFPSIELLRNVERNELSVDASEMEENKARITKTLNDYRIPISHIHATVGPTVTLYEIIPAEGVRISKIKNLEDDIALSLSALGIRIIAPIPGRGTIGIEVPNKDPQTVSMRSVIESDKYRQSKMELPMAMGCTISNEVFMADLCKMPHLLVAGATGMGKSVGLNAIIASLLYKKHPSELKFVLVDPKMVEFSLYAKLERHYLAKLPDEEEAIITDPSKVVATLNSLCVEMDNRYALLKDASMRNIKEYNDLFVHHRLNPEKGHRYLPYIVVIVDEFADLLITAGKEVETPIARIAQKARAVGIHMILATQRPSTNVITGTIKANFPGRIAFRVFQMVDSRTILDRPGANQLIGRGDMLFSNNGRIDRVQCAFIDTPEVNAICEAIDAQIGYDHAYELPEYIPETSDTGSLAALADRDPLFDECARLVVSTDTASTSSLQRRYSIGYNRAGKIMDQMEAAGIVGPSQGGKPRQVLVDPLTLERILENN